MIRRDFIRRSITAVGAAALGNYSFYLPRSVFAVEQSEHFTDRLFIPPLLEPEKDTKDGSAYSLLV